MFLYYSLVKQRMNPTFISAISKMIDHALLHPTLTDAELREGCGIALRYKVASVCVKPYAVRIATELLAGTDMPVCTVVSFPHGNSATSVKVTETIQACHDGAVEIDMVVNIGRVLSYDWTYVRNEIQAVHRACQTHGAILKVIFENDFLPEKAQKVKLCQICTDIGVEFVKTSTGFGFVKGRDGRYSSEGATEQDLRLMLDNIGPNVRVKASGGIRTLDELLLTKDMGVSRIGTSATAAIMEEAYRRFGVVDRDTPNLSVSTSDGY